ncbi:MAG: ABC transporter permease [Chryseolinea sp.]
MIKNFFLITLRNMMKNKIFILINVFGMGIAIACCLVAYFNWEFDATFDDYHANAKDIYRVSSVRSFEGQTRLYGHAPLPIANIIRENFPDVTHVVRMTWPFTDFKIDDNVFRPHVAYADSDFFKVFHFDFIEGTPDLKQKSKVFISEELAIKLFGSIKVVGKQITQVNATQTKEITVGGVFRKQPFNQSFTEDAYMNYDNIFDDDKNLRNDDWKPRATLFVMIPDQSRVAAIAKRLQDYRENNNKVREDFRISEYVLDPFVGMGRRDQANDTQAMTRRSSPPAAVVSPIIMSLLILLISCFNMTNTSIAISSRRLKEIGIRKVMGSMRGQLILQFIGETLFICAVSMAIGLLLAEVLINAWNSMWDYMKISTHYFDKPVVLLFLIGVLLFTGLIAGSYPALYISKFEPVNILKGKLKFGGTNYFTRTLLVMQYGFSLVAVIFAIAFYQNSKYQRDFDLGFNAKSIVIAYVSTKGEFDTYKNAIEQDKDIIKVAGAKHSVFSGHYSDPIKYESKQVDVDIIEVGDGYLETMGFTLLEGRDFERDSQTDRKESIIITQSLAKSMGWSNAIGKEVLWLDTVKLYVVGVVKDVYTQGLWRELDPMMIRYANPEEYTHVIAKAPVSKLRSVNDYMEKEWKLLFPTRYYTGRYIDGIMVQADLVNKNILQTFAFLGVVAILLSATGLYTLVSLNIIKRMKEIGVRKVLGASISNIARIINTEFVIMLVIASVIGTAISIKTVDLMMDSIWDYYLPASYLTIAISVFILFAVSGLAIGYKIFTAASMNPVNTLRTE